MARPAVVAAALVLLAMGTAPPACAGDIEDCNWPEPIATLLKASPDRVVAACRHLAEQGNATGEVILGGMYYSGQGVSQDYAEAANWYRKAAGQGYARGQLILGNLYADGRGVPKSFVEAAKWWKKAADQGDPMGQMMLGSAYIIPLGLQQDFVRGYMWLDLAATHFSDEAAKSRDGRSQWMTPEQVEQMKALAAKNRDHLATAMTPPQLQQAKALAAAWKPSTRMGDESDGKIDRGRDGGDGSGDAGVGR